MHKVYGHPRAMVVEGTHPGGQEAVLSYRTLGFHAAGSWLEIELHTGRTHQIRIQAGSRKHPVLGDELYGSRVMFGAPTADERLRSIALHARTLEFMHPMMRERISIAAPTPPTWDALSSTSVRRRSNYDVPKCSRKFHNQGCVQGFQVG